ncbi:MAG: hypothetical protein JO112_23745, partial [Planctomycetes bacterium]|nr:hypothetical protein [Planctomycetota bacterium]
EAPNENKVDPKQLQSVTLLVTPDQSAKLDLGENRGILHLALRNPEDEKDAKVRPATLNSLQYDQEKPLVQQVKELMEAYGKMKAQRPAPEPSKTSVVPAADTPPPPLEIRTLRGNYTGVVQIESAQAHEGQH